MTCQLPNKDIKNIIDKTSIINFLDSYNTLTALFIDKDKSIDGCHGCQLTYLFCFVLFVCFFIKVTCTSRNESGF